MLLLLDQGHEGCVVGRPVRGKGMMSAASGPLMTGDKRLIGDPDQKPQKFHVGGGASDGGVSGC